MDKVFITEEHINSFNSVVGEYMQNGFDLGFGKFEIIVGVAILVVIVKIVISKF